MSTIGFADMSGMMPLRDPTLLQDNQAQVSQNTWLYRGGVRGYRVSPLIYTLQRPTTTKQVYRIPLTEELEDWVSSLWLEFPDPYMSVIQSPVVDDQYNRYYFFPSSSFVADVGWSETYSVPFYAPLANIVAGGPYYLLGIPTPGVAPVVQPSAIVPPDVGEYRGYLYTYLSAYGEESAPAPPTVTFGDPIAGWNITVYSPTSGQLANRNITQIRVYRSVVASSGTSSFFQVAQFDIGAPGEGITFTDSNLSMNIVNNFPLPIDIYTPPPAGLDGVVLMANGIMAGFTNERELWFSEAFLPHAWPATFELTVPYPCVALNAIGSSLSILTQGQPSIATGTTPSTMTIGQITANEPCISRGSVYAAGEGTYYASPNGLILLNTSGTMNVSQFSMEREFWESMQPENWAAARQGLSYSAFVKGATITTTITVNNNFTIPFNGVVFDHLEKNVPLSLVQALSIEGQSIINTYWDHTSGQIFIVGSNGVYWWMPPFEYPPGTATPPNYGTLLPWIWKSKKYRMHSPEQLKAFKINFDIPPEVTISPPVFPGNTAQNQVFNPATQYLIVAVYADGNFICVREVTADNLILLITGGFKATYWEFVFYGQIYMRLFKASSSIKELKKA